MTFEAALADLTPLQREIVTMFLKGEGPADEALARRYAIPLSEVRSQRFLACDRLHRSLAEEEPGQEEICRRSA